MQLYLRTFKWIRHLFLHTHTNENEWKFLFLIRVSILVNILVYNLRRENKRGKQKASERSSDSHIEKEHLQIKFVHGHSSINVIMDRVIKNRRNKITWIVCEFYLQFSFEEKFSFPLFFFLLLILINKIIANKMWLSVSRCNIT